MLLETEKNSRLSFYKLGPQSAANQVSPCYHPLWSSDAPILQYSVFTQEELSSQTEHPPRPPGWGRNWRALFFWCSTHFARTYVWNSNAFVPFLHEADYPATWEAKQGVCRAHEAAQEHHTHQTAGSLLKNESSSGQMQENPWWGSLTLIRKITEGITPSQT